jgi:hypothetical protein
LATGLVALALVAIAPAASAVFLGFDLSSHPDGVAANDNNTNTWYGVRLDDSHTSEVETFSFNEFSADPMVLGNSTVQALIDTDTGIMTITGTIYHLQDSRSAYGIEATIQLDAAYFDAGNITDLQTNIINGTLSGDTTSMVLTDLDGGGFSPLEWEGFMDPSFLMGNNHRGVSGLSGWGWLIPNQDLHPDYGHTNDQDWLFTLEYNPDIPPPPGIPEPATVALLGIGLAGVVVRMRKFNA